MKSGKNLARYEGLLHAALRVVAGAMFACHGMQKILGWLTTAPRPVSCCVHIIPTGPRSTLPRYRTRS